MLALVGREVLTGPVDVGVVLGAVLELGQRGLEVQVPFALEARTVMVRVRSKEGIHRALIDVARVGAGVRRRGHGGITMGVWLLERTHPAPIGPRSAMGSGVVVSGGSDGCTIPPHRRDSARELDEEQRAPREGGPCRSRHWHAKSLRSFHVWSTRRASRPRGDRE